MKAKLTPDPDHQGNTVEDEDGDGEGDEDYRAEDTLIMRMTRVMSQRSR